MTRKRDWCTLERTADLWEGRVRPNGGRNRKWGRPGKGGKRLRREMSRQEMQGKGNEKKWVKTMS